MKAIHRGKGESKRTSLNQRKIERKNEAKRSRDREQMEKEITI